jgi:3-deoxy-7-phosphoheptulonate synthase
MEIAGFLSRKGVRILRGGAFKPRTSPFSFQGLGEVALHWMAEAADRYKMVTVSEVLDTRDVQTVASHVDILQIGARSMNNYPLLRAVGRVGHPVLLKRGMSSTVEELLLAAQYVLEEGNDQLILCERGIRTFEPWTRNTLDLAAIPLAKQVCGFPVIADLSHSLGRTDIAPHLARAALAAGADGIMCEVHPNPVEALSDGPQSLTFKEFDVLWSSTQPIRRLMEKERAKAGGLPVHPEAAGDPPGD